MCLGLPLEHYTTSIKFYHNYEHKASNLTLFIVPEVESISMDKESDIHMHYEV